MNERLTKAWTFLRLFYKGVAAHIGSYITVYAGLFAGTCWASAWHAVEHAVWWAFPLLLAAAGCNLAYGFYRMREFNRLLLGAERILKRQSALLEPRSSGEAVH